MRRLILFAALLWVLSSALAGQSAKPKLTLDEFFNSVDFPEVQVSPDGTSIVIETERADWEQQIFRKELWLYRTGANPGGLVQLTQSGHDSAPQWSPDSRRIAFLSERKVAEGKGKGKAGAAGSGDANDKDADDKDASDNLVQLYLISPGGGEAFAITSGTEEVHAFAWSADSKTIYFATREPWSKQQIDDHKKEWKDVIRYRGDERGDALFAINLEEALVRHAALGSRELTDAEKDSGVTPGAAAIAHTPLRVGEISVAHDGKRLAFVSNSVSQRQEKMDDVELFIVNLDANLSANLDSTSSPAEVAPRRLTHNEAVELHLAWAPDNRHLFFQINEGSLERKYEDAQPRLYWVDADDGSIQRWFADFQGEVVRYTPLPDGSVLCACRLGTEVRLYSQANPRAAVVRREGWPGAYGSIALSSSSSPSSFLRPSSSQASSSRIAFTYSAIERPTEVYIADGPDKLAAAQPITSFNKVFTERDLPKARPYHWTSDDGTPIEGMLMYPPGKVEAKNLPMFVLIHGGPQDADGNHFEADWYQWDRLAATQGWLVFEPNYRGSTGYGDKFALAIVPEAFSSPGRDILAGVDKLVKDGIADPNRLTIGGYSYGGYMTNWLITQTTRFKAAVTGAGGVENVADWGNDDSTVDDAWFLGGTPWEAPDRYNTEAAIFQISKVRTPTHMVAGADDIRVPVLEDYLLDRALHQLNIPSDLLLFPGEGHELDKNPWHGRIKVREELKWLAKYGGLTANQVKPCF
ncbi:MAG: prolyl oligopeptidase family serine peptidase [Terriglobales bacterium]